MFLLWLQVFFLDSIGIIMAKQGRPTKYTQELADDICERLAGGESMRSISRDDAMPHCATMFRWIRTYQEFCEQYDKAKVESADALVEDMLDIADNQVAQPLIIDGKPVEVDGKIVMVKDAVSVNHAKLRVDTRKWAASKLKPKKYGDRIYQETKHTGIIGLKDLSKMTNEELEDELQTDD